MDLRERSVRVWPVIAAVVVAAVTITVTAIGTRDEPLRTAYGTTVTTQGIYDEDLAHTGRLRLPSGGYLVGVTAPLTSLDHFTDDALDGRPVPKDGSFVGVSVQEDSGVSLPAPSTLTYGTEFAGADVRVELVVDGHRYPVPSVPTSRPDAPVEREAWVAVPGTPEQPSVAITFDGVRQTIQPATSRRVAGRAAPLYDLDATAGAYVPDIDKPPSCGRAVYSGGLAPYDREAARDSCTAADSPLLPYLPQFGWAPAGSAWLAIEVSANRYLSFVRSGPSGTVQYGTSLYPALRVSLDGTGPRPVTAGAPGQVSTTNGVDPSVLAVFRVPVAATTHRLVVATHYADLDTDSAALPTGAARGPDVTVTWTKELR